MLSDAMDGYPFWMQEFYSRTTSKVERGEVSKDLPTELVEEIVALIPFPYIFKAKALSRSWLAQFGPISVPSDEEKPLATLFQKLVAKASTKWPTFSPVCTTHDDLFGYHQASRKWQKLSSSLPFYHSNSRPFLRIEGALLYGYNDITDYIEELDVAGTLPNPLPPLPNALESICVANLLTREWKELPLLPNGRILDVSSYKLVSDTSLGTYKVIAVAEDHHREEQRNTYIDIYDSQSETWSSNEFLIGPSTVADHGSLAYVNGILYIVQHYDWASIWAFNMEERSLKELKLLKDGELDDDEIDFDCQYIMLTVFNGNLVMIMTDVDDSSIHVLQIDLELRRLREVARCELDAFEDIINGPISETNCIFYKTKELYNDLLLTYDQEDDAWSFSSFPVTDFPLTPYPSVVNTFQPSLNPFTAVYGFGRSVEE